MKEIIIHLICRDQKGIIAEFTHQLYQNKIKKLDKSISIITKSCPLFVPIVEENLIHKQFAYDITAYYLKEIIKSNADTLILGCTHYPLLIKTIKKVIGNKMHIVSSARMTSEHIKDQLSKKNLLRIKENSMNDIFYVSDKLQKFNALAKIFLNKESIKVQKILL